MELLKINEVVKSTEGKLLRGCEDSVISGIVIDSRKTNIDNMFACIIGENLDGHKFIESAYKNGCRNFLVSKKDLDLSFIDSHNVNIILVQDTQLALGDIAIYYKNKFKIPYIGVTGSVGKTTTRDMIFSALRGKYNAHKNVGNLNNHLGVPLTLFELNSNHECAVIEMGMSHFKEIEYLADMVHPKIGVISNIGLSHIENLGSQEGILKAKLEITKNFNRDNTLIINGDDKLLKTLKKKDLDYKLKSFGFNKDNDIYCIDYSMNKNSISFECNIDGNTEKFEVPTIGEHNILNAMSSILVGMELGMSLDEIRNGLNQYTATGMRLDIINASKYTIINDCYNASPDSMKSALKVLATFENRKVAILGDMFEMGNMSEIGHRSVSENINVQADVIITIGKDSKYIGLEAVGRGFKKDNVHHFESKDDLFKVIDSILEEGDVVLVKASRGMKLEDVVDYIK